MKAAIRIVAGGLIFAAIFVVLTLSLPAQEKAGLPTLLASCGQSPGPVKIEVFMKRLKLDFAYVATATANDLIEKKKSGKPYKSLIIVTGASLKGMGAAGISINDEIERTKALIAEARKEGIKIIGAHIEGMERRAQGAAAGRRLGRALDRRRLPAVGTSPRPKRRGRGRQIYHNLQGQKNSHDRL